jgi:hypothetical protein
MLRKMYFVGSGKRIKFQLSQALTKNANPIKFYLIPINIS